MSHPQLNRRRLLAAAAAMPLVPACTSTGTSRYERPLSRRPFVAPRISRDRVVRVIVGLRPYRAEGFVVRRERFDDKTLVHNYGHGGGGISLAWGSSALAVRELRGESPGRAAVLGSGIMGLTSARLLQDQGWQVTVYSRDPARHSTSNVGGGQWAPTSVFEEGVAGEAFLTQYATAARISHHAYQNLVGAGYGVSFIENYYLSDQPSKGGYYLRALPELFTSVAELTPDQHPFPADHVRRTVTLLIEPAVFLRRLRQDFLLSGGHLVPRNFKDLSDVLSLEENVLVNCTGLGSRALFDDEALIPIKGQLVLIPPDPAVDYMTIGGGRGVTYMFPRRGEILLGGSYQHDDWTRHPEPQVTERIIEDHQALFRSFG